MRYGSLFSGILGLDLAVEAFGYEPAWFCEIDKNPRKVIARRRPGVPIYGDITALDFETVIPVDLLVGGGFPCQPFSAAGKRQGDKDERYLWPEVARAVRILRPRIVVLENVNHILRFREGAERVCADLASLGYVGRTCCIRASDVGAPHRRERWFAVAYDSSSESGDLLDGERPRATPDPSELRLARSGGARDGRPGSEDGGAPPPDPRGNGSEPQQPPNGRLGIRESSRGPRIAPTDPEVERSRVGSGQAAGGFPAESPPVGKSTPTDPDGRGFQERGEPPLDEAGGYEAPRRDNPDGRDEAPPDARGKGLGEHAGGAPAQETRAGDRNESAGSGRGRVNPDGRPPTDPDESRLEGYGGLHAPPREVEAAPLGESAWGPYEAAIRRWERIAGPVPGPLIDGKLSPEFVTWMMGFERGWTEGLSRTAALKALGNAVVPQQALAALEMLGLPLVEEARV